MNMRSGVQHSLTADRILDNHDGRDSIHSDTIADADTSNMCILCDKTLSKVVKMNYTVDCGHEFHKECLSNYVGSWQYISDDNQIRIHIKCPSPLCSWNFRDDEVIFLNEFDIDYIIKTMVYQNVSLGLCKWTHSNEPSWLNVNNIPGYIYTNYLLRKICMECNGEISFSHQILCSPIISTHEVFLFECDNYTCCNKILLTREGDIALQEHILVNGGEKLRYKRVLYTNTIE